MSKTPMRSYILVGSVLLVVGCAGQRIVGWQALSGDNAQLSVHQMQCQAYAAQVAPYRAASFAQADFLTTLLYGERVAQFNAAFSECLQQLGYRPLYDR